MKKRFLAKSITLFLFLFVTSFILIACQPDEVVSYTVNFVTNGANTIESITVEDGSDLNLPSNPTKDGYTFVGWYLDESLSSSFASLPVSQDITLYAKWDIIVNTVVYNSYEGTSVSQEQVNYGLTVSEPSDPVKEGYVFKGWFLEDTFTTAYDFSSAVTSNLTLHAKWDLYIPSDEEMVLADIALLSVPAEVTGNVTFATSGENGTSYVWTSSAPHLISNTGQVLLSGYGTEGQTVVMTLLATYGTYSESFSYEIFVPEEDESLVTSSKTVDFESVANEYIVEPGQIELFFMNDEDLPYVDIADFIYLVDGAIDSIASDPVEITDDDGELYMVVSYIDVIVDAADQITVRFTSEFSQEGIVVETEIYEAYIDFTLNTFASDSFDFFESLVAATETDFGEGLTFGDTEIFEGDGVLITLNDYRFDLVVYEDSAETFYLMPLPIANLLFVGAVYYDVYYNGDQLYGIDSYQLLDGEPEVDIIKTSSFNNLSASIDIKASTYDFLVLAFDYFYGLKEVNGVDTYYNVFGEFVQQIIYGRDPKHYENIFNLTYSLDDLHTYHITSGYYVETTWADAPQLTSINQLGQRSSTYYENSWDVDDAIELAYPSGKPELIVLEDGLTAIITIDSFTVDTPTQFKRNLDFVTNQYPEVINIIVDISNNGGGNVGAVWRTLGYMTDDVIYYHSQNPTDGSAATYTIYDEYPAYNYNWFIMTSPVTFSAANLMASTAKEQGFATIIGLNSSGGASSISGIVLPTGDVVFMSSTNVISTRLSDGSFESVEYGVQVDYSFEYIVNLYDATYIMEFMNTYSTENAAPVN